MEPVSDSFSEREEKLVNFHRLFCPLLARCNFLRSGIEFCLLSTPSYSSVVDSARDDKPDIEDLEDIMVEDLGNDSISSPM